uniref:Uncharacterized protein n=1 Tax=Craspedostauros australis TaxID=1486917 RepID=A0A7S0F523_9STRA|mmetsp:Transcript_6313/g.17155  ORF Transcript_6313/g.17155 Transcript_6313/m.17155 type:complete len:450 (+) Transcript_6313:173-1522(+)|eukprot:CAMPEP_0198110482 /NCGR_PEP_ID=MMETSP1442-20131203/2501_1 /TAXON_ID= /ORGANISM="Craspedostauros australis, Strain CCMP3328" /LENGTH=449 /DNA_ID=CAMNT_0043766573 /DNA_START=89 /DNA_END=1438 /DNA_ORIENTATION=+
MRAFAAILALTSANAAILGQRRHETPTQRSITIHNRSGVRMDAMWINRNDNPITFHSNTGGDGTPYGGDQTISSFIGHEFELRELPGKKSGKCKFGTCRKAYIQVNDEEDQVVQLDKNFIATHTDRWKDSQLEARDLVAGCRAKVLAGDGENAVDLSNIDDSKIDELSKCVETSLNTTLAKKQEEHQFQSNLRLTMAETFIPYACSTPDLKMADEVVNKTWRYTDAPNGKMRPDSYQMKVYHSRPHSKIFSVDSFVSPSECDALNAIESSPSSEDEDASTISWDNVLNNKALQGLMKRIYALSEPAMDRKDLSMASMSSLATNSDFALQLETYQEPEDAKSKEPCPPYAPYCNMAETKKTTVVDPKELSRVFLFCEKKPKANGGIHFPKAGVHIHPQYGRMVWANIHHEKDGEESIIGDGFVQEYHFCANHTIFTHPIVSAHAKESAQA